MVYNQKTPTQYNSTLFITPMINSKKQTLFMTPPNPPSTIFDTPGSNNSLSFLNKSNTHSIISGHDVTKYSQHHKAISVEEPLSQAEKLRLWRHDALMQHHLKTAEFIGDKVLALTGDPKDAFWLAQVYFNSNNFLRAKFLLTSKVEFTNSISCRYLAAFSLIKLEMWDDALDIIGETNYYKKDDNYQNTNSDGGIRLEASMCYLRGLIYANQNNFEKAKDSFKEALLVDVKCYEAFNELISNNLMTPKEEWSFISDLRYLDADDNAELIKLLYISKLNKYLNIPKFEEAQKILKKEYDLGKNSDILINDADYLYLKCNFDECLSVCKKLLEFDQYNFNVIPLYLSCLLELGNKNHLFLIAHELAENHPLNPMSWLAIGVYYFSINKISEARKFFSKATVLNLNFGQAWIGFAHTFAAEGEHEQAISAYAFVARLFPGTHLPNLFLGMQYLQMNNLNLSEEYLLASYQICSTDPLLLNELGVIYFHKNDLLKAESFFIEALNSAEHLNSDSKTWISIHSNLGHVYRRGSQLYKALECFNQVLRISNKNDSNILAAMGLIYLKLGNFFKAINILHDALAISPSDSIASDLLKRSLECNKNNSKVFMKQVGNKIFNSNYESLNKKNKSSYDQDADVVNQTQNFSKLDSNNKLTRKNDSKSKKKSDSKQSQNDDFINFNGLKSQLNQVSLLANKLKKGNDSSDEDEAMVINSD